jgi:hypothetical protein
VDLATLLHIGLLQRPPRESQLISGTTAIDETIAFYTKKVPDWRVGTADNPHPLDPLFKGFREDEPFFALIIGRPGGMKSATAGELATAVAISRGEPVLYVGYEEDIRRRLLRLLAVRSGLTLDEVIHGGDSEVRADRLRRIGLALRDQLAGFRFLCRNRAVSPIEIAHHARDLRNQNNDALPLVVIDAIQNAASPVVERDRRREIDAIVACAEWIRDNIPARLLVLSHAAREGGGYNMTLSGAKESSGIEYGCDIGAVLHITRLPGDLERMFVAVEKHRAGGRPFTIAIDESKTFREWTPEDQLVYKVHLAEQEEKKRGKKTGKNARKAQAEEDAE